MTRWAAAALEVAAGHKTSDLDPGSCLNLGIISGGTKSNVITGEAFVHWSARLKPGESNKQFLGEIKPASTRVRIEWEVPYAATVGSWTEFCIGDGFYDRADCQGEPVDSGPAALFSAAGLSAWCRVRQHYQAHVIDEWCARS
jgi:acetylornithine deacetylase/succinyl-diaminopimelate desuccinylase-like protein